MSAKSQSRWIDRRTCAGGEEVAYPLAIQGGVRSTVAQGGVAAEPGHCGAHQSGTEMAEGFGVQQHLQAGQVARIVSDQPERSRPQIAELVGDHEGQAGDGRDGPWSGEHPLGGDAVPVGPGTGGHRGTRWAGVNAGWIRDSSWWAGTGRVDGVGARKIMGVTRVCTRRVGSDPSRQASSGA